MINKDRILWIVVTILLVTVIALMSYMQFFHQKQQIIERAAINSECGLSDFPCMVTLKGGGTVQLSLSPQPVLVLQPVEVKVELDKVVVKRVIAQFNGVGMNMGMNRYIFKHLQDGSYQATVTLPVCIRERMEWEAEIMLETEQGVIVAPFKFEAFRQ